MYLSTTVLKNICSEEVLQNIIKASAADFIFSKILCFQHILLNTFRRMGLKYEDYSLRRILLQTLKQSDCKNLIAKILDGNTLVLTTHFLRARSARKLNCAPEKLGTQKEVCPTLRRVLVQTALDNQLSLGTQSWLRLQINIW